MVLVPKPGQPRVINRVVTRGMGAPRGSGRASMIVAGAGGFRQFVEFVKRKAGDGANYVKENIEQIVIWAKLISINDEKPKQFIEGSLRLEIDKNKKISVRMSEGIKSRVRKTWEDIKITISRIR